MNSKQIKNSASRRQFVIGGATIAATTAVSAGQLSNAMSSKPPAITDIALEFFEACETGKGWEACKVYCTDNATFSSQTDALANINTLEAYTDWMTGLLTILEDGNYEIKSFATDAERNTVCAYAVFRGTHSGEGGPVPPTGKKAVADYVYDIQFEGNQIIHMTKIWNDAQTLRQLGWV